MTEQPSATPVITIADGVQLNPPGGRCAPFVMRRAEPIGRGPELIDQDGCRLRRCST